MYFPVIQTLQYCLHFHLLCFLQAGEDSGSSCGLSNSGFLCLFRGCHMFLAWSRGAAIPARGLVVKVVPLILHAGQVWSRPDVSAGTALFRMPLFPLCLLCDYLPLELFWTGELAFLFTGRLSWCSISS